MPYGLSQYHLLDGRQCRRKLWLGVHRPELVAGSNADATRLHIGCDLAARLQALYPAGHWVDAPEIKAALSQTRTRLRDQPDTPLFQAAFARDNVVVRVNLLLPEAGGHRLVAVEASPGIQDQQRMDLAIQTWVVRGTLPLTGISLAQVDTKFLYRGGNDYRGLFRWVRLDEAIAPLVAQVPDWVAQAQADVQGSEPHPTPGNQCTRPHVCPFYARCADVRDEPPFPRGDPPLLPTGRWKRPVKADIADIRQFPADGSLTERQRRVLDRGQRGTADRAPELKAFVRGLPWPRFFLSFVTTRGAVPPWAGTRPYQHLPVQWSCTLHWVPGALSNRHFLYDGEPEPQRAFAEALIAVLCQPCEQSLTQVPPGIAALSRLTQDIARRVAGRDACGGPILVYDGRFEQRILRTLARALPDLAPALEGIGQRILDLGVLLRAWYHHPAQRDSWSLQAVASTLDPYIRYRSLAIRDDEAAGAAWRELLHPGTPAMRQAQLRSDLVDYCVQYHGSMVNRLHRLQLPPMRERDI